MDMSRYQDIKRWRKRVKASDLSGAPAVTVTAVLEQWLMLIDELLEAVVVEKEQVA